MLPNYCGIKQPMCAWHTKNTQFSAVNILLFDNFVNGIAVLVRAFSSPDATCKHQLDRAPGPSGIGPQRGGDIGTSLST